MKKAMTLIELIFTIVIIAFIFSVIPKIIFSLNRSDSFSIRQDALFNALSLTKMISELPWDKNDTNHRDILNNTNLKTDVFDCNQSTFYRIGGFVGSRNCENNLIADPINKVFHSGYEIFTLDNIGDFNNSEKNATYQNRIYELNTTVDYVDDANSFDYDYKNQFVKIDFSKSLKVKSSNKYTNLKKIKVVVWNMSKNREKQISQFHYISANIGLSIINKRDWE